MNILITGSSSGIGRAICAEFLNKGHTVFGFDIQKSTIYHDEYLHKTGDVTDISSIPMLSDIDILINNAGVQNTSADIQVNLQGVINVTELYLPKKRVRSILNIADVGGHTGTQFPAYAASKGGVLAYTKNVAKRCAQWGCTCNSLSPGGVITDMNRPVLDDKSKWDQILSITPLKKWASSEEIAEWAYFLTVVNKSMTGQDVVIDNGEMNNAKFIW